MEKQHDTLYTALVENTAVLPSNIYRGGLYCPFVTYTFLHCFPIISNE